jgi:hypothetical protein
LRAEYARWRPAIERGLFEHFEPYGEGIAAGELPPPPGGFPRIGASADVWNYSTIQYILVDPLNGSLTVRLNRGRMG